MQRTAVPTSRPQLAPTSIRWVHRALVVCGIAAAATCVVMLALGSPYAMTAVACFFGLVAADALLGVGRRRAWRLAHHRQEHDRLAERRRVGGRIAVRIVIMLGMAAVLAAAIALGSERLALGIAGSYLLIVIVGAPVWIAAVGDEEDEVRDIASEAVEEPSLHAERRGAPDRYPGAPRT